MNINPFHYGKPVPSADRFVGRTREVEQIVSRLLNPAFESSSVVGERRIGKTSLLRYLHDPVVAVGRGIADKYCSVYISFEGLNDISARQFWQLVLGEISTRMRSDSLSSQIDRALGKEKVDFFDVRLLFNTLAREGWRVVLLFDEFEYIVQNTNLDANFYGALRHLASNYDLALVTSSRRELVHYCHSKEIEGSPFFNIFANIVLKPFTPQDALDLISRYTASSSISFSEDDIRYVLHLSGHHPYFLQLACFFLFDAWGTPEYAQDARRRRQYVRDHLDDDAFPNFAYYWSDSVHKEKLVLAALAFQSNTEPGSEAVSRECLRRLVSHVGSALDSLVKRSLVIEVEGGYRLISPRFHWWLVNRVDIQELSEEGKRTGTRRAYDFAAIRQLISGAFEAPTLWRFCHNRSLFRPMLTRCGANPSLEDMADILIEYCRTQVLLRELLSEIEKDNPRQYERHGPYWM